MQVMTFSEQSHGLPGGDRDCTPGRGRKENIVKPTCSSDTLHGSCIRHSHEIILVPAAGRRSLGLKYTNYATGHRLYTDAFADRVFVREQILNERLTENANGNISIYVVMRKDRSCLNPPPAYIEVLGSHSAVGSVPVLSAIDDLDTSVHIGTHPFEARNFCEDGPSVFDCQTLGLSCPKSHAVGSTAAGLNPDHVVSELLQLAFHLRRPSLAHSYNTDKSRDAHHQTEHG